ncbi:hypothetical protein BGW42_005498 [Actinomortierella wolfii]|nr:hypothetical protein BGW42_005498 [Actinomortierella wolfii]
MPLSLYLFRRVQSQNLGSRPNLGPTIGRGAFGVVHFARWDGQPCAVKIFFVSQSDAAQKNIKKEIMIMKELRHPHIILFRSEGKIRGRLAFIMEYAENGSLEKAIRAETRIEWSVKENITQGIVRGLAYIHSKGIIHRDIKSANVLLTKHMESKLCDFGLATVKDFSTTNAVGENLKGTIRWMAPELFDGKPNYNTETDVYVLGWIMWELATNTTPPFKEQVVDKVVIYLVREGERLPIPDDIPANYQKWIQQCWDQDPSKRPSATKMVVEESDPKEENEGNQSLVGLSSLSARTAVAVRSESGVKQKADPSLVMSDAEAAENTKFTDAMSTSQEVELQEIDDYHEMADSDDRDALYALGEMHLTSTGQVQDDFKAFAYFFRAAEKGHTEAQFRIAQMYQHGRSIPKDIDRARHWLEKAIEHGHVQAKETFNVIIAQKQPIPSYPEPHTSSLPETSQSFSRDHLPASHTSNPMSKSVQVAPTKLVFEKKIGSGSFANIYCGRWGTRQVAIKRLNDQQFNVYAGQIQRDFKILEALRHRNIIQVYGISNIKDRLAFIMELAEEGNLDHAINALKLDWPTKKRIAQEIVRGLAYLHEEWILHCDPKSMNVLLTRYMEIKPTGFSLAMYKRMKSEKYISYNAFVSTVGWMAPELFVARPRYSTKSDMYALGMVMWEMAADCATPFNEHKYHLTIIRHVKMGWVSVKISLMTLPQSIANGSKDAGTKIRR